MFAQLKRYKERLLGSNPESYLPVTVPPTRIFDICDVHEVNPTDWCVRQFSGASKLYTSDSVLARVSEIQGTPSLLYVLTTTSHLSSGLSRNDYQLLEYLRSQVAPKSHREKIRVKKRMRRNRKKWRAEMIGQLKKGGLTSEQIRQIGNTGPISHASVEQGGIWLFTEQSAGPQRKIPQLAKQQKLDSFGPIAYFQLFPTAEFVADLLHM